MAASNLVFTADETAVDDGLGYPKAFAKLCKERSFSPYIHAPPFTFVPYALPHQEVLRVKEFDEMFPVIDPNAKPTAKANIFVNLLWKQLNHLGNAGFDPEIFRVDPYGNVLYYHADSASPLAWNIDHWFPCSRGGLTVLSNLRILQWQVCKKKQNQLEFVIPWWDLQVGLSINQFLSIFASTNSDFRHRAFSWLFSEAENQELNDSQTVDSHVFPQHFNESKRKIGLSPAAVVLNRRESYGSVLNSLDINRRPRSSTPLITSKKLKENGEPDNTASSNPYQAIVIARDSLKHREEAVKMKAEIKRLDEEVSELKQKGEEEKLSIQDLELILIKKRRRAEKCRKLAEAQSSHRSMLEKMIRDAMHQSVVYKEQVRLNLAASNALMVRLEAQRAICDSAEKELYLKFKQRDELEQQIRPENEQKRKRSRMDLLLSEDHAPQQVDYAAAGKLVLHSPDRIESNHQSHYKQLRFLEEDHKPSAAIQEEEKEAVNDNVPAKLEEEEMGVSLKFPVCRGSGTEEDEDSQKQRGKGNVEKWLQILLENTDESSTSPAPGEDKKGIIEMINSKYPHKEINIPSVLESADAEAVIEDETNAEEENKNNTPLLNPHPPPPYTKIFHPRKSNASVEDGKEVKDCSDGFDGKEAGITKEKDNMERKLSRSESARGFRRIPSSPFLIFSGMKKRVDCMRKKKPLLRGGGDEDEGVGLVNKNSFIKSSFKTIVKAMKA
ncbi:hypothetical protein DM860_014983 [Cuscuta australis]|uniref:Uncharacterized protein n=1 Tax=Cuscuta australis TaxID=267555 RepID=A0A328DDR0_9ASTE|nr:hypothetical protein DM860_014983 [Cuscuta australis]